MENKQSRIKGMIINKFRGDISILESGIGMIEEKTGKKVLGCIPYADIQIEEKRILWQRSCPFITRAREAI